MTKPLIQVVDRDDNLIGHVARDEFDYATQIYRITALWLTNSQGQVLLAQRKLTKDKDPGKWGPAAAGTMDEGETYDENIRKETEEEIGVTDIEFVKGPKVYFESPRMCWAQWYEATLNLSADEFVIQEDEVEKVEWMDPEWLKNDFEQNPDKYVPSMKYVIETFINR